MKKSFRVWIVMLVFAWGVSAAPVLAKKGDKGRPAGWDQGEKKGWQSDVPPGQEDRNQPRERQQERYQKEKRLKGGDVDDGNGRKKKE